MKAFNVGTRWKVGKRLTGSREKERGALTGGDALRRSEKRAGFTGEACLSLFESRAGSSRKAREISHLRAEEMRAGCDTR